MLTVGCPAPLQNYFLSVGTGSQFRGANSEAEFGRQVQKTLKALTTMNADIYCVVELENLVGRHLSCQFGVG